MTETHKFYTTVSRYGKNILYRGYQDGRRIKRKIPFKPTLFVKGKGKSQYKTLDDLSVDPIKFDSMYEAKEFVEKYKDVENFTIYGNTNYVAQYLAEEYPHNIEFDKNKIRIHFIDIEVASDDGFPQPEEAKSPVTSITIYDTVADTYFVWALGDYDVEKTEMEELKGCNVSYMKCRDEYHLLKAMVNFWYDEFTCPDAVTGWNIRTFDIPYIVNRVARVLGEDEVKKLSPWGMVEAKMISMRKKQVQVYEITGIAQIDYLDLFMKFGYSFGPQERYTLDHIANVVLGVKKLSYEEYGNLHTLYRENHQKFIDYNIRDVWLVCKMEDKIAMIMLCMTMAYKAGVNYSDTMGTTAIWDSFIYRTLLRDSIIIPPNDDSRKTDYEGGFVKEPHCGVHDWVCSFDVASLYPNIIAQWNMSPETIIKGDIEYNVTISKLLDGFATKEDKSMAATGQYFSREKQGFLPKIIEQLYDERSTIKKKMLVAKQELENTDKTNKAKIYDIERTIAHHENQQLAIKIFLNSLYGALGNAYFRYFTMEIAEGITITGQYVIKMAEKYVNEYLRKLLNTKKDYIIAIDTDSIYVGLNDLVEKVFPGEKDKTKVIDFLDKACKKIEDDAINKAFDAVYKNTNAFKPRLKMKREGIADRGIWTAKKRYILNVWDNEGVRYAKAKLKIMGIEAIKSSTPAACREAFQKLFKILIYGTEAETQAFIQEFKKDFAALPVEEKAFPRSVSSVKEYVDPRTIYKKGTPINSRASILYNHLVKKHGLEKKYELIKNGEKIKYIYLNRANPIREDVIAFTNVLPPEFGLHRFVDDDTQFEKTFLDPAKLILDSIGWSVEERNSLEDFFA
jgi:DNA polymerase elongation subunit (family B)